MSGSPKQMRGSGFLEQVEFFTSRIFFSFSVVWPRKGTVEAGGTDFAKQGATTTKDCRVAGSCPVWLALRRHRLASTQGVTRPVRTGKGSGGVRRFLGSVLVFLFKKLGCFLGPASESLSHPVGIWDPHLFLFPPNGGTFYGMLVSGLGVALPGAGMMRKRCLESRKEGNA